MRVPYGLAWWSQEPGGAEWLASLPSIAEDCADQWSLELEDPIEPGHISLVVPVRLHDGEWAILKINFPEPESEHEADAIAHDELRRALLVERCIPGTELWSITGDEEATRIGASVLRRLWRPAPTDGRYRRLEDEAARWAVEMPRDWEALGRPYEPQLLDEAVATCRELGADQGAHVVLHQDFHGGNVLRAQREPWLAIDPKPLVGERAFDAASLLRDRRWELGQPDDARRLRRRLDVLAEELAVERERMRLWGITHALAWGVSGMKLEEDMIHCARLLFEARP
jgi:streptomycin 6-kinase